MAASSTSVASLMARFRQGDQSAANQLVEVLYPELKRLAVSKMKGERVGHTWQPTLLVNELYFALLKTKALGKDGAAAEQQKAAFLGFAGFTMKRLLIEHSRPLYKKVERIPFRDAAQLSAQGNELLHEVEVALSKLAELDPKFRAVVEMRVFEGLTGEEIAEKMGCSPRSVANYWNFARAWLSKELADPVRA
jgi:RNA polymerase sigma factor (TIGR02999 family)